MKNNQSDRFKTPISIIKELIEKGELGEYKNKKALGGVLTAATQIIPVLSSLYSSLNPPSISTPAVENTNPYGMRNGGNVEPNGFKQYNSPTHEQGGQSINNEGSIIPNGENEIEGTENLYKYSNIPNKDTYVFSDVNGTSDLIKEIINKKFKNNPDLDTPTKNLQEFEIQKVENLNESINTLKENITKFRYGSKLNNGGPTKVQQDSTSVNTVLPEKEIRTLQPLSIDTEPYKPSWFTNLFGSDKRKEDLKLTHAMQQANNAQYNRNLAKSGLQGKAYEPGGILNGDPEKPTERIPTLELRPVQGAYTTPKIDDGLTWSQNNDVSDPLAKVKEYTNNPITSNSSSTTLSNVHPDQILRGATLGLNALQLLNKPLNEELISTNYQQADSRINAMNANLDSARDEILSGQNTSTNAIRSASSSYQQQLARQLQNTANTSRALSNVSTQEQQLRNQILSQQGQFEANKAVDFANRTYQNRLDNLQNQAQNRNIKRSVLSDLVSESDRISTIRNNKEIANASLEETKAILKSVYPDFEINDEFVDKTKQLANGEITNEEYQMYVEQYSPIKFKK